MQKSSAKQKVEFFEYKGLPLVRKGDTIYYGNMEDDYVVMMTVLKKKKFADLNVASRLESGYDGSQCRYGISLEQ